MSEVDRLSNSGLYPALPIADKRGSSKEQPQRRSRDDARAPDKPAPKTADNPDPAQPRPPKSVIDEYA